MGRQDRDEGRLRDGSPSVTANYSAGFSVLSGEVGENCDQHLESLELYTFSLGVLLTVYDRGTPF